VDLPAASFDSNSPSQAEARRQGAARRLDLPDVPARSTLSIGISGLLPSARPCKGMGRGRRDQNHFSKGSDTAEPTSSYFAVAFSKVRKENHPKRTVHASRVRVE
jgi:hypothetical protein